MRKPFLFKCLFVACVAMVLVSWAGGIFGDEDGGFPDCQPADLWTQPFVPVLDFLGYHSAGFCPLLAESFASFLEMHEKSPPPAAFFH